LVDSCCYGGNLVDVLLFVSAVVAGVEVVEAAAVAVVVAGMD